MIEFKELKIEDKDIIIKYIDLFNPDVSELNFTNLFIWRHKYNFKYEVIGNFLWVLNECDDGRWCFSPPIGDYSLDYEKSIVKLKEYLDSLDRKFIIKKVSNKILKKLENMENIKIKYEANRDAFDYVYNYKDLKELKGNKYHKKKNHVNHFLKEYDHWNFEKINEENLKECLKMEEKWCKDRNCDEVEGLRFEKKAIKEAVENYQSLNFEGSLIRINDVVEAFTFCERLNDNTIVIHIEKANTDYHGLYNMINQQNLLNINDKYQYVNREQDLGINGLRKSKLSYHPEFLLEKYIVEIL